jgi:hypothetical protein
VAYDITKYAQYRNQKQKQKIVKQRKRHQWQLKSVNKELNELQIELDSKLITADYQLAEKDEVIRLLDKCLDSVVVRINREYFCKRYSFKTKAFFNQWNFCLQPDYHLPDIFPMTKFDEWMAYIDGAFAGESLVFEEILINKILKNISLHKITIIPEKDENEEVTTILIRIEDISEELAERRRQNKESLR